MDTPSPLEQIRRVAEDAQRYRDYAEMSSDWYWEQDDQFRFTYFSREFEEITGVASSEGLGKTRWQGLGKERLSAIDWDAHQKSLQAHQPFRNLEYPSRRADGKIIWFRVSGKPRFDTTGTFLGYFGIASEISASKQMAAHLQQSERLASIGQLAAGVAHEINNPIGFVRSNLETLGGYLDKLLAVADLAAVAVKAPTPHAMAALQQVLHAADIDFVREDAAPLLQESRSGLDRVKKIVAELREFSCEGQDGWSTVDLHTCLQRAIHLLGSNLPAGTTVQTHFSELPLVRCRPAQIHQLALALLTNAVQALAGHGGTITVTSAQATPETVYFEVGDSGCGIAPEHLAHVFEPFFTTRAPGHGTGMGLAMCFGIVRDHGGNITVSSVLGKGSQFRVSLPLLSLSQEADANPLGSGRAQLE